MAAKRMNKDEFYKALSALDEDAVKKALWTLYWRGTNQIRERIEVEIQPATAPAPASRGDVVDPEAVLGEITEFVSLARKGAYELRRLRRRRRPLACSARPPRLHRRMSSRPVKGSPELQLGHEMFVNPHRGVWTRGRVVGMG